MRVLMAPRPPVYSDLIKNGVFLSGAIDMGGAERWQDELIKIMEPVVPPSTLVLNPRRDDWDDTWVQSMSDWRFAQQVRWELQSIAQSALVLVCLPEHSKAPITLLELGLMTSRSIEEPYRGVAVYCHPGFYRAGNVAAVCEFGGFKQVSSLSELATFACRGMNEGWQQSYDQV